MLALMTLIAAKTQRVMLGTGVTTESLQGGDLWKGFYKVFF